MTQPTVTAQPEDTTSKAPDPDSRPDPGHQALNPVVFGVSATVIVLVALAAIVAPDSVQSVFDVAVGWASRWFGSFYILLATVVLVFVVVLALSRFGRIRLGPDNATPDFSTFSWAAMLFAAGVGTAIMFYAVAEPVSQYMEPPTGQGGTSAAARQAVVLTLFHYGVTGWGLYALVGLALGYFAYRRRRTLAVRSTLRPLFGDRVDGLLGDAVDAAALVGGVFGIAASLGVGVVQLNVGLRILFGLPQSTGTQIGLIALSVMMATLSAVSGVDRGVRILSNINVLLAVLLALWVLVTGNTAFLLDAVVGSVGDFLSSFPFLTLETYAYDRPEAWLNAWTLFFWAWWITWAAFVGMFLARISRGRTIRQFVVGALVLPFSYVVMWVGVFGNSALDLIRSGDQAFADLTVSAPEQGLYSLLERLPGGIGLVGLSVFVGILFYVTSADSGALVMANLSSRVRGARQDAAPWLRVFWAAVTGVLTVAMLVAGGITILQQATIVMALPFSIVLVLVMVGLWRALTLEAGRAEARRHATHNRLLAGSGAVGSLGRGSWRDRLSHTLDIVSPERARRALEQRVVPALEAVAVELRKENLSAQVVVEGRQAQDPDDERNFLGRASLVVSRDTTGEVDVTDGGVEGAARPATVLGQEVFRYVVRMVEAPVPAFGVVVHEADDLTVRLEVRPRGGGQGYDIMGWSSDQVSHDVLDHYERWLEFLAQADAV